MKLSTDRILTTHVGSLPRPQPLVAMLIKKDRDEPYDRAFPDTLRIVVEPDQPVAILRSGADGWLVSAHGAVLSKLQRPFPVRLPRIWVTRQTIHGGLPAAVDAALRGLAAARRSQSALSRS